MSLSLSIPEARKLVLLSQGLPKHKSAGKATDATLAAIEQLGYIQIDTISVIERAHHHTLWNRVPGYRYTPNLLDQLLETKQVFEYWSHAAAYLPMRDYRFSLIRKRAIASGEKSHWYERDSAVEKAVLKRITEEGPLMAKDFESEGHVATPQTMDWTKKPAKRALENLFMQGDLMVPRRIKFQKVYDLTERVLPDGLDSITPTMEEYASYLIVGFLRANGLTQMDCSEICYLLGKDMKPLVLKTVQTMLESGELVSITIGNPSKSAQYLALPGSLKKLLQPLSRKQARILSPFDNLVIQRKRMLDLFDFDYQIECYVPEPKRKFGYFALPILWDGRLVARMDCKADRKSSTMHVLKLLTEPGLKKVEALAHALSDELQKFTSFNGCKHIELHEVGNWFTKHTANL